MDVKVIARQSGDFFWDTVYKICCSFIDFLEQSMPITNVAQIVERARFFLFHSAHIWNICD